jgi:hypothetical protein
MELPERGSLTIRRAERTRGQAAKKKVPKGRKIKYSNFLITINTNHRVNTLEEYNEFADRFEEAIQETFDLDNLFDQDVLQLGRWNAEEKVFEVDEIMQIDWKKHVVLGSDGKPNFTIESGTEESPNNKGVHAHIFLQTAHYAHIKVNAQGIKEALLAGGHLPEVPNPYVNIQIVKGSREVLYYIRKGQSATPRQLDMTDLNKLYKEVSAQNHV